MPTQFVLRVPFVHFDLMHVEQSQIGDFLVPDVSVVHSVVVEELGRQRRYHLDVQVQHS